MRGRLRAAGRASSAIAAALLLLTALPVSGPARGEDLHDSPIARNMERPRFAFDAGAFWRNDSAYVGVAVLVPYRELMFRLDGARYLAKFDLIVVLYEGDRQVAGNLWNERIEIGSLAEIHRDAAVFRKQVELPARPRKYRVEVEVSEQDSGNEGRLAQEIEIPDLGKEALEVGKVWFVRCPGDSAARTGMEIPADPLVGRRFGAGSGPVCAISWVGGSDVAGSGHVSVHYRIYDSRRQILDEQTREFPTDGQIAPVRFPLPLDKLWLGGYELRVEAKAGGKTASRTARFEMDESMVSLVQNPAESISMIRYIATGDEIAELEAAPPEDRDRVWKEFWKRRDPSPETPENEFEDEFFARVRYANENFTSIIPGWKTDRGMIYIQYGPPDQVESYPHQIDGPPMEIWIYNSIRRRFVFIDYDGFGRYELYTPGRR
ncbi:MAG: GWxTD domain-containing protein [Candidatus Eisenbacteria bacterium]